MTVDTPATPKRHRKPRTTLAVWIGAALLLYVLSAGPAFWMAYRWGNGFERESRARAAVEIVYAPVEWIASHAPQPVYSVWQGYTGFFFDAAYRAESEKWLTHPSAQSQPSTTTGTEERGRDGSEARQSHEAETASREEKPAPETRIAGRTIAQWQEELKRIDPQIAGQEEEAVALIELMQSPEAPWFTRRQAALTLGRMHAHHPSDTLASQAIPVLIGLLETSPSNSRSSTSATEAEEPSPALWAAQALALFGPAAREAAPSLLANLRNERRPVTERISTIESLAVIGAAHPDAIPGLIDFLEHPSGDQTSSQQHEDARTLQEAVLEAFAVMGPGGAPAIPAMMHCLHDPAESMRRKSAATLGALGGHSEIAVPMLLEVLAFDESSSVRDAAADALGKIGLASLDGLERLADQPDPELRRRAVVAIGGIGRGARSRVDLFIPRLDDDDPAVRFAATEALWKIDPQSKDLLPALVRSLSDDDRQHRMVAYRILVKMGPKAHAAIDPLRELLHDDRSEVRRLAEQTLEKLDAAGGN